MQSAMYLLQQTQSLGGLFANDEVNNQKANVWFQTVFLLVEIAF